ncbi:hypothetical protein ZYGR_0U02630 [Zygosaccharomyces rouxii]|uniref:Nucleolar GTP-binding protein 1 n=2 Tax=Zygosaccharomyces rouxii TaxID=4956 RepID=C5DYP4_ZYGRC|nr:uncharacterized protein ZYRO0F14674g [Zygosaccharomyces rouxii]KAH9199661.1 P-loop containing nucleoside triphosphate hydrolase protein [Zygosaccharomyces rouxii]GAV50407.1 hypothetical protein ZYGR_0U02630 [Zygosaccharomyces rouxii]CAR28905.1 ZYRO0F14674p [Zygosaccharomyces rouxii]
MQLTWKNIPPIATSDDLLDIVLNRTQRKTPTIIRPGFKITRIRAFYMRKVKFTGDGFVEKFEEVIKGFPNINDVHPFHRDLMDTLYEKNHYKISLAAISRAKSLVEQVSRDYIRLLKFGQSLFQCKQLKKAALGRMATIVKKLKDPLVYLEQVRQHLGRLPSIDPNTRTLLICGYPNVGKSSFLRCITKADVEVQPYAFTTKSLYVGHFDYKYLRFQAIDTPGILDRPTEEMNNIEMQSIYAVAHLRSCVLYFMDISEQCGFTLEAQVKLFHSIKPLFANKSVMVVVNKTDIIAPEDLDDEHAQMLNSMKEIPGVEIMATSCQLEENIMAVRNKACEKLLASRIENKLKSQVRVNNALNKIHVAQPQARDDVERTPFIPEAFKNQKKYDHEDPDRRRLARDIEEENGGAGVFNVNLKDKYLLEDEEWKNDVMPEILNGRNVYDFLDPDISAKLQALEEEEEKLENEGFYESDEDELAFHGHDGEEVSDIKEKAAWIRDRQRRMIAEARNKKSLNNRAVMPRSKKVKSFGEMEKHMTMLGHDLTPLQEKQRLAAEKNKYEDTGADVVFGNTEAMSGEVDNGVKLRQSDRLLDGVSDGNARSRADRMTKLHRRERNRQARAGEADRHTTAALPKHLFSGKRGMGKTDYR